MESPRRVREPHVRILLNSIFFLFGGIKLEDLSIDKKYTNARALNDLRILVCVALRRVLLLLSVNNCLRICGVIGSDCFTGR